MTLVYIAGPYRAGSAWQVEQNIRRAEELALAVWKLGAVAICPHTNTRHFQGELPDNVWLEGDLEILRRCDAVLLCPNWRDSEGATREAALATQWGIPVVDSLSDLGAILEKERNVEPKNVTIPPEAAAHREHLAVLIATAVRAKYNRGQIEHGGYLPAKGAEFLCNALVEEGLDTVIYGTTLKPVLAELFQKLEELERENQELRAQLELMAVEDVPVVGARQTKTSTPLEIHDAIYGPVSIPSIGDYRRERLGEAAVSPESEGTV